jgi:energy-coupling factor transport system permease protein
LTLLGLLAICAGTYGLLGAGAPTLLGVPMMLTGAAVAVAGFAIGNRASGRTHYRPDAWRAAEWAVAACGLVVAASYLVVAHLDPMSLDAIDQPLKTPDVPWPLVVTSLAAALPAWLAPPVPRPSARRDRVGARVANRVEVAL